MFDIETSIYIWNIYVRQNLYEYDCWWCLNEVEVFFLENYIILKGCLNNFKGYRWSRNCDYEPGIFHDQDPLRTVNSFFNLYNSSCFRESMVIN